MIEIWSLYDKFCNRNRKKLKFLFFMKNPELFHFSDHNFFIILEQFKIYHMINYFFSFRFTGTAWQSSLIFQKWSRDQTICTFTWIELASYVASAWVVAYVSFAICLSFLEGGGSNSENKEKNSKLQKKKKVIL